MSIEVTKIPKEPQWEDIVIDVDKEFNWFDIIRAHFKKCGMKDCFLNTPFSANNQRITHLPPPLFSGDALSLGNPIPAVVGDAPFSFNDTSRQTTSMTYEKQKETRIWRQGTYRISFDLTNALGTTAFGRIYRNGAPVGTERSVNDATWVTFTEDISGWKAGDFVQVYVRSSAGGTVVVKNLRIYIHESDFTEEIM